VFALYYAGLARRACKSSPNKTSAGVLELHSLPNNFTISRPTGAETSPTCIGRVLWRIYLPTRPPGFPRRFLLTPFQVHFLHLKWDSRMICSRRVNFWSAEVMPYPNLHQGQLLRSQTSSDKWWRPSFWDRGVGTSANFWIIIETTINLTIRNRSPGNQIR